MATCIEYGGGPSAEVRSEATKFKYGTQLVGYTGYIPGMKYTYGKSFPALSHCLAENVHDYKHHAAGYKENCMEQKYHPKALADEKKQLETELSKKCKERKYLVDLPPGYAGAIPRYLFKSTGLTFGNASRKSLKEFVQMKRYWTDKVKQLNCDQECSQCLVPVQCEDEVTRSIQNSGNKNYPCGYPCRRQPMEVPITGYMGYLPRSKVLPETCGMNHLEQSCYAIATFDCFNKHQKERLKACCVDPYSDIKPDICMEPSPIHRIYMQDGMIPRYKGVVPENMFVFGKTFGDSTRSVECCKHEEANFAIHQKKKLLIQRDEPVLVIT